MLVRERAKGDRAMTTDPERSAAAGAQLSITLPPVPEAAGMARRALREALQAWNVGHLDDTAILLVSELVGNAIRHARATTPGLELRMATDGTVLRMEVLDPDPRTPTVRNPSGYDESGYGLVLVQALADAWGVRELAIGKSVWVELRTLQEPECRNPSPNGHSHGEPREAPVTNLPSRTHRSGRPAARRTNVARMFDRYHGGKVSLAADRKGTDRVLSVAPVVPRAAKQSQAFFTRAIQFLATQARIGQFIDIGPGLPSAGNHRLPGDHGHRHRRGWTAMTVGRARGGRGEDVLAVAAAMLRYALPDVEADGIRLETSRDSEGTWLRLIYPPGDSACGRHSDASELMLIDSVADRWGVHGGPALPSTLWALLR